MQEKIKILGEPKILDFVDFLIFASQYKNCKSIMKTVDDTNNYVIIAYSLNKKYNDELIKLYKEKYRAKGFIIIDHG